MGTTLHVERLGRTPTTAIELVHSPDDGGYYLSNQDFQRIRSRTSKRIYATSQEAVDDWQRGTVEWEEWN